MKQLLIEVDDDLAGFSSDSSAHGRIADQGRTLNAKMNIYSARCILMPRPHPKKTVHTRQNRPSTLAGRLTGCQKVGKLPGRPES